MSVVYPDTVEQNTLFNEEDVAPYENTDDPNHRTHYINPPMNTHIWMPGMETRDIVTIARLNGLEVVALCGHRWVPKHNPDKFDLCEKCNKIAMEMLAKGVH